MYVETWFVNTIGPVDIFYNFLDCCTTEDISMQGYQSKYKRSPDF